MEIFVDEIPEEHIKSAAELIGGNFITLLEIGEKFREAGVTPIYVSNEEGNKIKVFAAETFRKKLH